MKENYKIKTIPEIPEINDRNLRLIRYTQNIYDGLKKFVRINPDSMEIVDFRIKSPVGNIPARIYYPGRTRTDGNLHSALMFLHGGGFVMGSIGTHDGICKKLAEKTGRIVVSAAYRLAPKHIYPSAIRDSYCVYYYLCKNSEALRIDRSDIAIGGTSAGGNIALGVMEMCLRRKKRGVIPSAIVLQYPLTDIESVLMGDFTESALENADGRTLTLDAMTRMLRYYIPYFEIEDGIESPHLLGNPYLSPVKSELMFQYPRVIMISAGKDILRDDNRNFAEAMASNGVEFEHHEYKKMLHAFMSFDSGETEMAFDQIAEFLG
ncbi:MAG: alpha/beta hydrolase [Clostridia bacterium]|nr:alpha/beta hydrolase [Clostridia bacterium]